MKREVCYVCRLLLKKTKQLLPLVFVIGGLVFITKIQITRSHNGIFYPVTRSPQGLNTSIKLATRSPASRELSSREPSSEITQIKQANNSRQGETNAANTRDVCKKFQPFSHYVRLTVRWSKANDLLFCPIYKVGTTFWRRVFMIQREKKYSNLINPYLLPFDKEYAGSDFQRKGNVSIEQYKVMFTRDPYNRLFSFYVDKMLAPNPYFWKSVGVEVAYLTRQIRREKNKRLCGHDVTFREFIKYVIYTLESRKNIDPHWIEMEKNCQPCEMNYDFIGKMENFNEDSKEILQKLGLTSMADFLDKNGKEASVDDAIRDTLSQPFTFRARYRTCLSFQDAILRAWKKLQIRGLIGEVSLDGLIINEKVTKLDDLISRARTARNQSTALERKEIKNKMFNELWDQVDTPDMYKLKKLYAKDFKLFGYDDMPSTLFSKRTVT